MKSENWSSRSSTPTFLSSNKMRRKWLLFDKRYWHHFPRDRLTDAQHRWLQDTPSWTATPRRGPWTSFLSIYWSIGLLKGKTRKWNRELRWLKANVLNKFGLYLCTCALHCAVEYLSVHWVYAQCTLCFSWTEILDSSQHSSPPEIYPEIWHFSNTEILNEKSTFLIVFALNETIYFSSIEIHTATWHFIYVFVWPKSIYFCVTFSGAKNCNKISFFNIYFGQPETFNFRVVFSVTEIFSETLHLNKVFFYTENSNFPVCDLLARQTSEPKISLT